MCGIFGVVGSQLADIDGQIFKMLLRENASRGDRAYGIVIDHNTLRGIRELPPQEVFEKVNSAQSVLLGHLRAPTEGSRNTLENCHPFYCQEWLLAHNGMLLNADKVKASISHDILRGLAQGYDVDTPAILYRFYEYQHLTKGGLPEYALRSTLEELEGSFACWLYDPSGAVYLFSVISPIWYSLRARAHHGKVLYFSSTYVDGFTTHRLPEGVIYKFEKGDLDDVLSFRYYTPYLERPVSQG